MVVGSSEGRPSPEVFLSSAGTGLALALIYVGIVGGVFDLAGAGSLPVDPAVACLAVMSALYAVGVVESDRVSRLDKRLVLVVGAALMIAAVAAACALTLLAPGAPAWLSYILAVLYGAGITLFRFAGVGDFSFVKKSNALFIAMTMVATAGAGVALGSLCEGVARYGFVVAVIAVEFAFYFFSGSVAPERPFVTREQSRERLHLSVGMAAAYGLVGVIISYLAMEGIAYAGASWTLAAVGLSMIAAVGVAALFALAGKRSALVLSPVYHVTFLPLIALVLVAPYASGAWAAVAFFCLLLVLFFRDFARLLNRLIVVMEVDSQLAYVYAWTSFPLVLGMFLGAVLHAVAVGMLGVRPHEMGIVLALLVAASGVCAPYGIDPQSMPTRVARRTDDEAGKLGYWRLACEEIAERFKMTPRELDVALLLSRGRTADVIARNLGISIYTVKTHISSVYRKSQVASQQGFISLVEEAFDEMKRAEREPKDRI